jgi:hypothetical protein
MENIERRRRGVTSWLGSGLGEENDGDVGESLRPLLVEGQEKYEEKCKCDLTCTFYK